MHGYNHEDYRTLCQSLYYPTNAQRNNNKVIDVIDARL